MASFEVSKENGPGAFIISLCGDIDMAVVPRLRASLDELLEAGCQNLILDMEEATYIDSSFLGLIVYADHRLRPCSGRLVVAAAATDLTRILELSGLISVAPSVSVSVSSQAALEGLELPPLSGEPLWSESIEMPFDVNELAGARESACDLIRTLSFPDSAVFDIRVALGEALANAIRHGSPESGQGHVDIVVIAYSDRVIIEVADRGAGFDGRHSVDADPYADSGRGVLFMRRLMDRVEFEPASGGGTLVRLTKHRAGAFA